MLALECQNKGLTLKDFFEKSGISQPTWSRIMRGQSKMSLEDLKNGCDSLELQMSMIIDRAETIAKQLPKEDVKIVNPKDIQADQNNGDLTKFVLASAALAFLISKLMK
ncbi:helix-turn-helix domain-containing protein [Iodidimonas nitroreducens]|uniref:helix-turn-helix domain-containing protein n=1 Tax=Iodidimonas nitroreducens TaxID=1236968 RepID=UPI0028D5C3DA|nr:helix-turn-helix transcriptional regulator [Iodidimonas nitroreducens]